jgi:hypothetical protein
MYNDIALVVLKEEVDLKAGAVSTISLAEDGSLYAEGTSVSVIGWGVDTDGGNFEDLTAADVLQELEYEISNQEECRQYWIDDFKTYESSLGLVEYDYEQTIKELTGLIFIGNDEMEF